ncbi:MAG TPA: fructose-bisphosphate aldolase, partial [Balneolaceae bacterium]|nr:fructose-bisphosphate aldolase [Balneolaceae bacterium]
LLNHKCQTIRTDRLIKPTANYVDDVWYHSDRNNRVLQNLQRLLNNGRLGGTGFLSILPVDQGIEHSAGASFAKNPDYFDPANIVEL